MSEKVRVYQLAKELGMPSKQLAKQLIELKFPVKNHMSTMDEETAQKVRDYYTKPRQAADEKQEQRKQGKKRTDKEKQVKPRPESKKGDQLQGTVARSLPTQKQMVRPGKKTKAPAQKRERKVVSVEGRTTVRELASALGIGSSELIKSLMDLGVMATINQELDTDAMQLIAEEMGFRLQIRKDPKEEQALSAAEKEARPEDLKERPPVVTVLGHVDHGKTSLLDYIRHTRVTASEAGGITQHIGASRVTKGDREIVFLDTPGHEAFTAMRARGAQVTDIAVLVVAADDGVMPQTVEAINHVRAAGVPMIVAINKIDKPNANPDRVKQQLVEQGLVPEEWGGDTIIVPVSALKGDGVEDLLEMVLLVADMQGLKANPEQPARGTVIEAKLERGRGAVATVLVQNGTLKVGDPIVCGYIYGKVRAMMDDRGNRVKTAGPSMPVEIIGLSDVPQAGDVFLVATENKLARQISEKRQEKQRQVSRKKTPVSLDDMFKQFQEDETKQLKLIIKGDVHGSVEALRDAVAKLPVSEGVRIDIIHSGVGAVTESDVMLASASGAVIIGFNVRSEPSARKMAEQEQVEIRLYRIIYEVLEDLEKSAKGMLAPKKEEVVLGEAEVRQIFNISRVGTIAGCYVREGKVTRNAGVRVVRDGKVIFEGQISGLKRFKDDAREVASGYECGISLENFNDLKEGDIIEAFTEREVVNSD